MKYVKKILFLIIFFVEAGLLIGILIPLIRKNFKLSVYANSVCCCLDGECGTNCHTYSICPSGEISCPMTYCSNNPPTPIPQCVNGQIKCVGSAVVTCINRQWDSVQYCAFNCYQGSCCGSEGQNCCEGHSCASNLSCVINTCFRISLVSPAPQPIPSITLIPTLTPVIACACPHPCYPGSAGCWRGTGPYSCPLSCCSMNGCPSRVPTVPTATPTPKRCWVGNDRYISPGQAVCSSLNTVIKECTVNGLFSTVCPEGEKCVEDNNQTAHCRSIICSCPHSCQSGSGGCWWGNGPYTCDERCCNEGKCPILADCNPNFKNGETKCLADKTKIEVCIDGEIIIKNCTQGTKCDPMQNMCVKEVNFITPTMTLTPTIIYTPTIPPEFSGPGIRHLYELAKDPIMPSCPNGIQIIVVWPNSTDPTIRALANFMKAQGFTAMTHEDVPETKNFSCYNCCQFWSGPRWNNTIVSDRVYKHEIMHNRQAANDPLLANHISGDIDVLKDCLGNLTNCKRHQNNDNKAYQSLIEGHAELQGANVGGSRYNKFENFYNLLEREVNNVTVCNGESAISLFNEAVMGGWDSYKKIEGCLGEDKIELLLKQSGWNI